MKVVSSGMSYAYHVNASPTERVFRWNGANTAFALFICLCPAYPMPGLSTFGFISPLLFTIVLAAFVFQIFVNRQQFYWNQFLSTLCMSFSLLFIFDFLTFCLYGTGQLVYLGGRVASFLISLVAVFYFPSVPTFNRLIKYYFYGVIALSCLTIVQGLGFLQFLCGASLKASRTYFGFKLPFAKAIGFEMSDGEFGLMVSPVFIYMIMQFFPKSPIKPTLKTAVFAGLTGLALIICQSRSTWLGLCLALGFLFLVRLKSKVILFLLIGLMLTIDIGLDLHSYVIKGLVSEGVYERNVTSRGETFVAAIEAMKNTPFLGAGHGNTTFHGVTKDIGIHNQVLEQGASSGIISMFPLLFLYYYFWITCLRIYRASQDETVRFLAAWLGISMIQVFTELMLYRGFYSEPLAFYFALLAILYGIHHRRMPRHDLPAPYPVTVGGASGTR
ncbi:MAG: O-antigen ligase family protein [Syntrophobacteraceae bacterium]